MHYFIVSFIYTTKVVLAGLVILIFVVGGVIYFKVPKKMDTPLKTMEMIEVIPTVAIEKELVGEVREISVVSSKSGPVPSTFELKKGENIRLTFKNIMGRHMFSVKELDIKTGVLGESEEEEFEFVVETSGTFAIKMIVE